MVTLDFRWPVVTTLIVYMNIHDLNNSQRIDMSLHSETLSWFRANQSLLFLLNAACLAEKLVYYKTDINIISFTCDFFSSRTPIIHDWTRANITCVSQSKYSYTFVMFNLHSSSFFLVIINIVIYWQINQAYIFFNSNTIN